MKSTGPCNGTIWRGGTSNFQKPVSLQNRQGKKNARVLQHESPPTNAPRKEKFSELKPKAPKKQLDSENGTVFLPFPLRCAKKCQISC